MNMKVDLRLEQKYQERREFVFGCVALGMASLIGPKAFARSYADQNLGIAPYDGPLLDVLYRLNQRLDLGQISPEGYIEELRKRLMDIKLKVEFEPWIEARPEDLDQLKLYNSSETNRKPYLSLVFTKPGWSHIPHGHHGQTSIQTVVDGELHVREYERVKKFEPGYIGIKKSTDKILKPGESFTMTDMVRNIHWFGSEVGPVIHLNSNVKYMHGDTFYPLNSRRKTRILLDPTGDEIREGLTVAKELSSKEEIQAHWEKFQKVPLSHFE